MTPLRPFSTHTCESYDGKRYCLSRAVVRIEMFGPPDTATPVFTKRCAKHHIEMIRNRALMRYVRNVTEIEV